MFTVTAGARGGISSSVVNQVLSVAQAAADYWARYIDTSLASIDIQVNFLSLGGTTLAQAGTDYYFAFSSGGLDYFEPATLIEIATGFDENGFSPDIPIDVDTATLNAGDFNLGPLVDGVSTGGGGYDLWSIFVHEIAHGLGLLSFIDEGGADRSTFDRYVSSTGGGFVFNGPDPGFGPIALDSSIAHVAGSVRSVLNPSFGAGYAAYLTAQDVSIFGDMGAPLLRPTGGDDVLAGFGTRSTSSSANPALHALGGNDTVIGLPTADQLFGDDGNDFLSASAGGDLLEGGDGDDDLRGGAGADALNGGAGSDFADYSTSGAVRVDLAAGGGAGAEAVGDSYNSIEGAFGSASGDTLIGDGGANGFSGLAGSDSIDGAAGADIVDGGGGQDMIDGGAGDDFLSGESQRDTISGGAGDDSIFGGTGKDRISGEDGADDLRGGTKGDSMNGAALVDALYGESGNDALDGGGDDDLIVAGAGRDVAFGGAGADTIVGAAGEDTLEGGAGNDLIFVGRHDDLIYFGQGGGTDTLRDFSAGGGPGDVFLIAGFGAAFDTFADILAAATDNGADTTIDFGGGDALILRGVLVADLAADDFTFG